MRTAVVICPGRGTYNASELGYLAAHFPDADVMADFENQRLAGDQPSLASLDGADRYSARTHGRGDNSAALIYAASLGDFLALDRSGIEVVAVTGNSMGWYTALACAGALSAADGFRVANTMGGLMQAAMIGGQMVYPWVGEDWVPEPGVRTTLLNLIAEIGSRPNHSLALSIDLGGMLVVAGDTAGLAAFETAVPRREDRFPMRLANHAAFHTALQAPVAARARATLPATLFGQPALPVIDGRGAIWWPGARARDTLRDYTLAAQVTETYDFTRAVAVAAREFAPDLFVILGPGTTLGGAVAQALILAGVQGLANRTDFKDLQSREPLVLSMGRPDQRALVT
ncbi:ACP S-malonyltransferase [Rhodophyticola sp.]|jgi:malonyl CoA-acyl carrier protein transacylase|uniref:ACP S-malonyltransferase n=1 Tax=Rhodophyticola sp. TaxID=2680032 RepID=UPI003D27A4CE